MMEVNRLAHCLGHSRETSAVIIIRKIEVLRFPWTYPVIFHLS